MLQLKAEAIWLTFPGEKKIDCSIMIFVHVSQKILSLLVGLSD